MTNFLNGQPLAKFLRGISLRQVDEVTRVALLQAADELDRLIAKSVEDDRKVAFADMFLEGLKSSVAVGPSSTAEKMLENALLNEVQKRRHAEKQLAEMQKQCESAMMELMSK